MSTAYLQVERLIEVKRYREARQMVAKALSEYPDEPFLHCLAARIAIAQNATDEAWSHVDTALKQDPSHSVARMLAFQLLDDAGDHTEAERVIIELIRDYPEDATLYAFYARLMLMTLHVDKAEALVREAIRLDPNDETARFINVLITVIRGRREDADQQLKKLIRENPDSLDVMYLLFNMLIEQSRFREAEKLGQQILRLVPDDQELSEQLIELRTVTHWAALPAYFGNRYGWKASIGIWIGAIILIMTLGQISPGLAGTLGIVYFGWVVYTWTYRPILKRWIRYRGL
jgi:predicted Zn-dependent protease